MKARRAADKNGDEKEAIRYASIDMKNKEESMSPHSCIPGTTFHNLIQAIRGE